MSFSDNSTAAVFQENYGSEHLLDGQSYGDGDLTPVSYEQSPYADTEIVSLHVGPDTSRFDVHSTILCQSAVLVAKFESRNVTKQYIHLPEIDEATAHTVVHYLYTNTYQALRVPQQQAEKAATQAYKLGTCVYCAAVRYQLPGLAGLAKEKITTFGEDVSIFEILNVARDHAFSVLPDKETWYPEYLEGAVKSAMDVDPGPFRRPDFITQVEGNTRLLQVVWKTVMSNYTSVLMSPEPQKQHVPAPSIETAAEEFIVEGDEEIGNKEEKTNQEEEECKAKEEVASSVDVPAAKSKQETTPGVSAVREPSEAPVVEPVPEAKAVEEETLKLDDIEPTVETPQAPEPFTDELGFESSKTYQKMGRKADASLASQVPAFGAAYRPVHKRSDSVMQEKESLDAEALEEVEELVANKADDAPLIANGSSDTPVTSKKKQKNKKKKNSTVF